MVFWKAAQACGQQLQMTPQASMYSLLQEKSIATQLHFYWLYSCILVVLSEYTEYSRVVVFANVLRTLFTTVSRLLSMLLLAQREERYLLEDAPRFAMMWESLFMYWHSSQSIAYFESYAQNLVPKPLHPLSDEFLSFMFGTNKTFQQPPSIFDSSVLIQVACFSQSDPWYA